MNCMKVTTQAEWLNLIQDGAPQEEGSLVRRSEQRFPILAVGVLRYYDDRTDRDAAVRVEILQASAGGCMLRCDREVPLTQARLEVRGDPPLLLSGTIRHCTTTVGALKVGLELCWPDAEVAIAGSEGEQGWQSWTHTEAAG